MTEFRDDPDADRIGSALSRLLGDSADGSPSQNGEAPAPWPAPSPWPETAEPPPEAAPAEDAAWPGGLLPATIPKQVGPVRVRTPDAPPEEWPGGAPAVAPSPSPSPSPSPGPTPTPPPQPPRAIPDADLPGPRHFGRRLFGKSSPQPSTAPARPSRARRAVLPTLLRQRRRILLSTAIVALGVAYLAGSLSLLGRVSNGLNNLAGVGTERADLVVEGQIAVDSPLEQTRQLVPDALVPLIQRIPGVAAATGRIEDTTVLVGTDLKPIVPLGLTQQPLAANWPTPASLNPYTLLPGGHAPEGSDQVVIDAGTAQRAHLKVGDRIITSAKSTAQSFTIVGIATLSGRIPPEGTSLALFSTATARDLFDRATDDNSIGIKLRPGADRAATIQAIQGLLPYQTDLVTGAVYEQHHEVLLSKSFQLVRALLIGFAGLALIVGAFTVANSNTLLFARRRQGFAMLRLVGASPGQLAFAAFIEASLVGVAAVVVGIPLGLLVGKIIEAALARLGSAIPVAGSPITPTVLIVSTVVGLGVTIITAAIPARDAAKASPLVALTRSDADASDGWPQWLRVLATVSGGAVLGAVLGVLLSNRMMALALGAAIGAGGALLSSLLPLVLSGLVSVTTRLLIGTSPALRSLTALRSRRARSRAASTTAALLIATAVVAGLSTLSSTFVASVGDQVSQIVHADLVVDSGTFTRGGLPETLVTDLGKVPGVTASSGLRIGTATIDSTTFRLTGVEGASAFRLLHLGVANPPARLDEGGMLVSRTLADNLGLTNGQSLILHFSNADVPMRIQGIFTAQSVILGDAIINADLLNRVTPSSRAYFALLDIDPAQRTSAVAQIKQLARASGITSVYKPSQLVASRADVIDGFEQVIQWMLLFSVAIAIIGVANTLQLSVNERRRELGLLRAVGGTPGQVIRIVLVEAAALSLVGAAVGTALGLAVAYGSYRALAGLGLHVFAVPGAVVVGTAVAAFALGLLGAWLPALTASRAGVMDALGEDLDAHGSGFFDRVARHRTARVSRKVQGGPPTGPPGPPPTAPTSAPSTDRPAAAPEREDEMARCYQCGNDPGDGEFCAECGAQQVREPAGMFSTAPPAARPASAAASTSAPAPTAAASGMNNGRWSTGADGPPAPPPPRSSPSAADDGPEIVDAAIVDDDDEVVDLGTGTTERRSPQAGPPPPPMPRTPPPSSAPRYRTMSPPPEWHTAVPEVTSPSQGEAFGSAPSQIDDQAELPDPNGFAAAISRLAPSSQENGASAFMVAGALLGPTERVLVAVQGWSRGMPAVAVLTTTRAVVVCERQWQPLVESFPLRPSLAVYGRHLEGRASMTFQDGDQTITLEQIAEVPIAVELAEAARTEATQNTF